MREWLLQGHRVNVHQSQLILQPFFYGSKFKIWPQRITLLWLKKGGRPAEVTKGQEFWLSIHWEENQPCPQSLSHCLALSGQEGYCLEQITQSDQCLVADKELWHLMETESSFNKPCRVDRSIPASFCLGFLISIPVPTGMEAQLWSLLAGAQAPCPTWPSPLYCFLHPRPYSRALSTSMPPAAPPAGCASDLGAFPNQPQLYSSPWDCF